MIHAPDNLIYESPDGGQTVYVRTAGSDQRRLHSISQRQQDLQQSLAHSELWTRIHRAASEDPALQHLLEQAECYYHLRNSPWDR